MRKDEVWNNTGNRQAEIHDQRNESGLNYINKVPSPISERKNLLFALSRNPFKCSYTWVAERKKSDRAPQILFICFNHHKRGLSWDLTAFPCMLCIIHKTEIIKPQSIFHSSQLNRECQNEVLWPLPAQREGSSAAREALAVPSLHCMPHMSAPLRRHTVPSSASTCELTLPQNFISLNETWHHLATSDLPPVSALLWACWPVRQQNSHLHLLSQGRQ